MGFIGFIGLIGSIGSISPISAGEEGSSMMKSKKMGAAILFIVLAVVSASGRPRRSQERDPATQSPPSAPSTVQQKGQKGQEGQEGQKGQKGQKETSDAAARRQAYVRFIEARRLRGESQRLRNSARWIDEAVKAYKETIQLDPAAADPHVDLGELYFFFQARRDLAEAEAREALRLDPDCADAHLLLARLHVFAVKVERNWRPSLVEQAIRAYEKVAELDPKHAEAWAMLADLYGTKNDTARQIRALEKWAGAPIPNDPLFYNTVMNSDLSADQAY